MWVALDDDVYVKDSKTELNEEWRMKLESTSICLALQESTNPIPSLTPIPINSLYN